MIDDPVSTLDRALEGRYRIERELGEGGMASVYLAEDLKHERKVALKVLKPELAAVVGAERFLAEIRTTASLQHPNILPLFDSGEADGILFYVTPFVEGHSLRERLDRERQLPVAEAVRITTEAAEALDHAHRQGVVHRDIKPANILLADGRPLVCDFGVALAVGVAGGSRLTETGFSPGTPQYMSPEQATGDQAVGPASDVYSLACVLYECLAGEPPYTGGTPQAILGRIVTSAPEPITAHRTTVAANVEAAISKALEKVPADRFSSASEFGSALADVGFRYGARRASSRRTPASVLVTTLAVALAVVVGLVVGRRSATEPSLTWSNLSLPLADGGRHASRVALSPDGARFVYVTGSQADGSSTQTWVRDRSEPRARLVPSLSDTGGPVFSPDGQSLAVVRAGPRQTVLLAAGLDGSGAVQLAEGDFDRMGHRWADDGTIYLGSRRGIQRVPSSGGEPELVTRIDVAGGESGHYNPVALPRGRGLLFTVRYEPAWDRDRYEIAVTDLEGGGHEVLMAGLRAEFAEPDILLYVTAAGQLLGTRFDAGRLELEGAPFPIADSVKVGALGAMDLSVSAAGTLVYESAAGVGSEASELALVSRDGTVQALAPDWTEAFFDVRASPDGSRLAMAVGDGMLRDSDIWVWSAARRTRTPVTSLGVSSFRPSWTFDGSRVRFHSDVGNGDMGVWETRPDGSGEPELLVERSHSVTEAEWSSDGRWLVYRTEGSLDGGAEIRRVDLESGEDVSLLSGEVGYLSPSISADSRWIAYVSGRTGVPEVWIASFPHVDQEQHKISQGGGSEPVWARAGSELFFRDGNDDLVVAEIAESGGVRVALRPLFSAAPYRRNLAHRAYDVMPGDSSFVMIRVTASGSSSRLVVIDGFSALLSR